MFNSPQIAYLLIILVKLTDGPHTVLLIVCNNTIVRVIIPTYNVEVYQSLISSTIMSSTKLVHVNHFGLSEARALPLRIAGRI